MDLSSFPKWLPVCSLSMERSSLNKPPNNLWKVQKHFSGGKVTVTFFRTSERRSRCKRNKWKGPARSAGSSPFMAACFLTVPSVLTHTERLQPHKTPLTGDY